MNIVDDFSKLCLVNRCTPADSCCKIEDGMKLVYNSSTDTLTIYEAFLFVPC